MFEFLGARILKQEVEPDAVKDSIKVTLQVEGCVDLLVGKPYWTDQYHSYHLQDKLFGLRVHFAGYESTTNVTTVRMEGKLSTFSEEAGPSFVSERAVKELKDMSKHEAFEKLSKAAAASPVPAPPPAPVPAQANWFSQSMANFTTGAAVGATMEVQKRLMEGIKGKLVERGLPAELLNDPIVQSMLIGATSMLVMAAAGQETLAGIRIPPAARAMATTIAGQMQVASGVVVGEQATTFIADMISLFATVGFGTRTPESHQLSPGAKTVSETFSAFEDAETPVPSAAE